MKTFTLDPDQQLAIKWWEALPELKRKYLAYKYYSKDEDLVTIDQVTSIWEKQMFIKEPIS